MPCGLIYSSLALAATAQNAATSALMMFLFGLGTVFIRWSTNTLSPAAAVKGLAPEHTEALRTRMRACLPVLIAGFVTLGPGWLGNAPSPALLFLHTVLRRMVL